jgi:hypothetical protein
MRPTQNFKPLAMKMTSDGRRPQNSNGGISQHRLFLNLSLGEQTKIENTVAMKNL